MGLSSLARSPECELLLRFALNHGIPENWDAPQVSCYVNGRQLSGERPVGQLDSDELVIHLSWAEEGCVVHLSTVLALATAYIKFQYEAVAAALRGKGVNVANDLDGKAEGLEARVMVYSNLVARHGIDSEQAEQYFKDQCEEPLFEDAALGIRLRAKMLQVIASEYDAKIERKTSLRARQSNVVRDDNSLP